MMTYAGLLAAIHLSLLTLAAPISALTDASPLDSPHGKKILVEIEESGFHPLIVSANVGDSIVFVNRDTVEHTVTQMPGGTDSGLIAPHDGWIVNVQAPGLLHFRCRFSPGFVVRVVAH